MKRDREGEEGIKRGRKQQNKGHQERWRAMEESGGGKDEIMAAWDDRRGEQVERRKDGRESESVGCMGRELEGEI